MAQELQTNPYAIASTLIGKDIDHPDTVALAEEPDGLVDRWREGCRRSAYVFDDTYEGMPISEAIKALLEEGFDPVDNKKKRVVEFHHPGLSLLAIPRSDGSGNLKSIMVGVNTPIIVGKIVPNTFCGLGLQDPEIVDDVLQATIDATGGFRTKMHVLRSISKFYNIESFVTRD